MFKTLYRKYRPKSFDEVVGEDPIKVVLKSQIKENKVAQAYLFSGPRGTGKTSIARILAKSLNCKERKDSNPCKICKTCLAIDNGRFLDLIEIDAASNRGIDEIRRLKEKVNFAPTEGLFKIYIIDEVHMLTKEAFNALLKTLEEPPKHVIFILATTEINRIPPTIISRCQRFNFSLAKKDEIIKYLKFIIENESTKISKEALEIIAENAGGSFRDAATILEKVISSTSAVIDGKIDYNDVVSVLGVAEENSIAYFVDLLLSKKRNEAIKMFSSLYDNGISPVQFTKQVLERLEHLLIKYFDENDKKYNLKSIMTLIKLFTEAGEKLSDALIPKLPIEVAIFSFFIEEKKCNDEEKSDNSKQLINDFKKNEEIEEKKKVELPQILKETINKFKSKKDENSDLNELKAKWKQFLDEIKKANPHLGAFLTSATLERIENNCIVVKVGYKFHKLRIESPKSQTQISAACEKIYGKRLNCICEVSKINSAENEIKAKSSDKSSIVVEIMGDIIE